VLGFLEAYRLDAGDPSGPTSFAEADLRLANRGGARISAAEIAAIVERRRAIERALSRIAPRASLVRTSVPWLPLRQLFDAFAGIPGVGFAKMTKALHSSAATNVTSTATARRCARSGRRSGGAVTLSPTCASSTC
jgi:hypothetical protein